MKKILVALVARAAAFLALSEPDTVDPDTAMTHLESMAYDLQQLSPAERQEFIDLLNEVAEETPFEGDKAFMKKLPKSMGIA